MPVQDAADAGADDRKADNSDTDDTDDTDVNEYYAEFNEERVPLSVATLIERVARRPVLWRSGRRGSSQSDETVNRQLCWKQLSRRFRQDNGEPVTGE